MRAFIASAADKTIHLLSSVAHIDASKTRVAFIANAADQHAGTAWWIDADRKKFQELGYTLKELDLRAFSKVSLAKELESCDIIHMCGGNLLYLLSVLQEKDLLAVIKDSILRLNKIYTGTSAGSMIAAPSVELEKYSSEANPEVVKKLKNFDGIGIVNFLIVPHSENPDFVPDSIEYVRHLHAHSMPLFFAYDTQAFWIEDDSIRLLTSPLK